MKLRKHRFGRGQPVDATAIAPVATPCLSCSDKWGRPFAVTPVKGRSAGMTDVVVPAEALLAAVDGNLVAFLSDPGQGVLLNASAALIFTAFDGERPVSEIVAQLASETGMDRSLIASDVRATVDRLLAQGIVTLASDEPQPQPQQPATAVTPGDDGSTRLGGDRRRSLDPARRSTTINGLLAKVPWVLDRPAVPVIGSTCRVRADSDAVAELLRPVLPGSPTVRAGDDPAGSGAAHQISIVSRERHGRPDFRVVRDGRVVARVDAPEWAAVHALNELDLLAVEGTTNAILFHAGAVERDGRVVIVLGISGKGKSTLTAALVQHGFRYVSDEVVALAPGDLSVVPYPKALDLDPASLALLGIDSPDARFGTHKDKVLPSTLGEVSTGGKPALIVFLAETLSLPAAAGEAPVEQVPPAEALVALLPVTFEQTIADPAHFGAMADLCEQTPAIRIGRAPLAATISAVEAALA